MQSTQPRNQSPKFVRRSMSPIDYINSNEYRAKQKQRDIHVEFGYVGKGKLGKVGIKRREREREQTSIRDLVRERVDGVGDEGQRVQNIEESSFLKGNQISGIDKSMGRIMNGSEQTNDTDFLRVLDEDSQILKTELNLHNELYNARKKIFQLEAQLEYKTKKLKQQNEQLIHIQARSDQNARKAQYYACELQRCKIKVVMERRKSSEFLDSIRRLKEDNLRKKSILDRVMERERKLARVREYCQFFELSPEKEDKN